MGAAILAIVIVGCVIAAVGWFLLGFRLGGSHWHSEMVRTQLESVSARRQLHDLTRQAFVAMAEHSWERTGHERPGIDQPERRP